MQEKDENLHRKLGGPSHRDYLVMSKENNEKKEPLTIPGDIRKYYSYEPENPQWVMLDNLKRQQLQEMKKNFGDPLRKKRIQMHTDAVKYFSQSLTEEVRMQMVVQGGIAWDITIVNPANGKTCEAQAIIDTGSYITCLTEDVIKTLELVADHTNSTQVLSIGKDAQHNSDRHDTYNVVISDPCGVTCSVTAIKHGTMHNECLLGRDFLQHCVFVWDGFTGCIDIFPKKGHIQVTEDNGDVRSY